MNTTGILILGDPKIPDSTGVKILAIFMSYGISL